MLLVMALNAKRDSGSVGQAGGHLPLSAPAPRPIPSEMFNSINQGPEWTLKEGRGVH